MKKYLATLAVLLVFIPCLCFAAPAVVTQSTYSDDKVGFRQVIFTCTASTVDGSIPVTATTTANTMFIKGYQLFQVDVYPTSGGTAPDAADVFILDANNQDLLGSIDGSTTAYEGLNLIHATLPSQAVPSLYNRGTLAHKNYFPYMKGIIRLKVSNQATNGANYTVVLSFWGEKR